MDPVQFEVRHFDISPTVVPAGKRTTVTLKGHGGYHAFYDDLDYQVRIIPKEKRDYLINDDFNIDEYANECNIVDAVCKDGVLSFEYTFEGEQEWAIALRCKNGEEDFLKYYNPWRVMFRQRWSLIDWNEFRYFFRLYSVEEDLYGLKPFKGDLHTHTDYSDGTDTPELFCGYYRGYGYDFIAITDHYEYDGSIRAVERMKELDTGFKVFLGEEVHVIPSGGLFHIVNFNGKSSVNKKILADYEGVKAEVFELAKSFEGLSERDSQELAWFKWITDEIRKVGGMPICAHPFDTINFAYNTPTNITVEALKRGFFDAYELLNCSLPGANNQIALYFDLLRQGLNIPAVGTTDSHGSTDHGMCHCANNSTVVFAKNAEAIPDAIRNMMCTAVSHQPEQRPVAYGSFRLVKYTCFLLENYFPLHNELCKASSVLQTEYFKGNTELKPAIEAAEERIAAYDKRFFGKEF